MSEEPPVTGTDEEQASEWLDLLANRLARGLPPPTAEEAHRMGWLAGYIVGVNAGADLWGAMYRADERNRLARTFHERGWDEVLRLGLGAVQRLGRNDYARLAPFQRRVVEQLAAGLTQEQAAEELGIKLRTLRYHHQAAAHRLSITQRELTNRLRKGGVPVSDSASE